MPRVLGYIEGKRGPSYVLHVGTSNLLWYSIQHPVITSELCNHCDAHLCAQCTQEELCNKWGERRIGVHGEY